MTGKTIRMLSLIVSGIGLAVSAAGSYLSEKTMGLKIEEEVRKAMAEKQ